ncbi:MAG: hypothetical protein ACTSSH_00180 [Candidatus Heimdallarchaeota archaeon]
MYESDLQIKKNPNASISETIAAGKKDLKKHLPCIDKHKSFKLTRKEMKKHLQKIQRDELMAEINREMYRSLLRINKQLCTLEEEYLSEKGKGDKELKINVNYCFLNGELVATLKYLSCMEYPIDFREKRLGARVAGVSVGGEDGVISQYDPKVNCFQLMKQTKEEIEKKKEHNKKDKRWDDYRFANRLNLK